MPTVIYFISLYREYFFALSKFDDLLMRNLIIFKKVANIMNAKINTIIVERFSCIFPNSKSE